MSMTSQPGSDLHFFGVPTTLGNIESAYSTISSKDAQADSQSPVKNGPFDRLQMALLFGVPLAGLAWGIAYFVNDVANLVAYPSRTTTKWVLIAIGGAVGAIWGALKKAPTTTLRGTALYVGSEGLARVKTDWGKEVCEQVRFADVAGVTQINWKIESGIAPNRGRLDYRWLGPTGNVVFQHSGDSVGGSAPNVDHRFLSDALRKTSAVLYDRATRQLSQDGAVSFPFFFPGTQMLLRKDRLTVTRNGQPHFELLASQAEPVCWKDDNLVLARRGGATKDDRWQTNSGDCGSLDVFMRLLSQTDFRVEQTIDPFASNRSALAAGG